MYDLLYESFSINYAFSVCDFDVLLGSVELTNDDYKNWHAHCFFFFAAASVTLWQSVASSVFPTFLIHRKFNRFLAYQSATSEKRIQDWTVYLSGQGADLSYESLNADALHNKFHAVIMTLQKSFHNMSSDVE